MNYLVIYDNNQVEFDNNLLHKTITTLQGITDWWHYLPNAYIVTSVRDSKNLADQIIKVFSGLRFLIVKLDLREFNGVLNEKAWEWIRKKNNIQLRLNPLIQFAPPRRKISTGNALLDELLGYNK